MVDAFNRGDLDAALEHMAPDIEYDGSSARGVLRASIEAATRSIASRARSGLLTLTFNIGQLPSPRNWAIADGLNGRGPAR